MRVWLAAVAMFPAELITVNSDYSIQPYDKMQPFGDRQVQGECCHIKRRQISHRLPSMDIHVPGGYTN